MELIKSLWRNTALPYLPNPEPQLAKHYRSSPQKSSDSRSHPAAARQPPDGLLRNIVVWGSKEVSAYRGVGVAPEPEEMFLTQMGRVARLVMDFSGT
jgi:hypothetical protein